MNVLEGKNILLGVTGGIAIYKSCELIRLLKKAGANVQVVMTETATKFISPMVFEALSSNKVATTFWSDSEPALSHIALRENKDLFIVAPCTANVMAKIACGIADDLLTSTVLARSCPLAIYPAMNVHMWENPATQRNIQSLIADGIYFGGTDSGEQACGDCGQGRFKDPREIFEDIYAFFTPKTLKGKKVLMTVGPTFEAIDPVRGITNRSSGSQGYAIALEASRAGAEVYVVSGPVNKDFPKEIRVTSVTSASEMKEAVFDLAKEITPDAFIGVAAVSDWAVKKVHKEKIKKVAGKDTLSLELVKNPDIISELNHSKYAPRVSVAFAAETNDLIDNAKEKLKTKKASLVVANPASVIGSNDNCASFVTAKAVESLGEMSKADLAKKIIEKVALLLQEK